MRTTITNKKRWLLIISAAMLTLLLLTSCGGGDKTYNNIAAQSNPYSMGKQSVLIEASSANAGEPSAKFKPSISPADIEIGQALEGKTVTEVVFNSETSITVTLEGNTKAAGGDGVYGTITVKQSGMASKGASACTVNLRVPEIKVASYSAVRKTAGDVTTHNITAKLNLPAGAFTDKALEGITLADGETGELTVALADDGALSLTISNCNTATPSIRLEAGATTLGKGVAVKLSSGGNAKFE